MSVSLSPLPFTVHIFDTDCYGVMWHGAYVKWLEMARCQLLTQLGIALGQPGEGYVYPVVRQEHHFRKPARLNDALLVFTNVQVQGPRLVFQQTIARPADDPTAAGPVLLASTTTCAVCDAAFKPFRRVPADLLEALAPALSP